MRRSADTQRVVELPSTTTHPRLHSFNFFFLLFFCSQFFSAFSASRQLLLLLLPDASNWTQLTFFLGNTTRKRAPTVLSSSDSDPWCAAAIADAIARPKPAPLVARGES